VFLNVLTLLAPITEADKLFHIVAIFTVKEYFLKL